MSFLDDARMFRRFAAGLRAFLREPVRAETCAAEAAALLRNREQVFLTLVEHGIYGRAESPYRKLLIWAGVDFGCFREMVERDGVEATLERLFDAGVKVTVDEFKGRTPIRRPGFELHAEPHEFDSPLLVKHYEASTGGSGGSPRRLAIDLDLLARDVIWQRMWVDDFGVAERPNAQWRPVPPGSAGMKRALSNSKMGFPKKRWFTPNPLDWTPAGLRSALLTSWAVYGSRMSRFPLPVPEYTPIAHADKVARWLADQSAAGNPAYIDLPVGLAVRACGAALDMKLDITGTLFKVGGQPYTRAVEDLLHSAGAQATCHYSMSEVGPIGMGCGRPLQRDEVHVLSNKIAVVQRPVKTSDGVTEVNALHYTTLEMRCPKIMLNVDSGDYGVLTRGDCGCRLGRAGLGLRIHTIRSYEKLSTEGMFFLGSDLIDLIESALPERFGGRPTNYQFAQVEENGLLRTEIAVSPSVGPIDEEAVVAAVLGSVGSRSRGDRMKADHWRQAGALRVVREEPRATAAGKVLPVWIQPSERR